MCGKFSQMYSWSEIHAFSTPLDELGDDDRDPGNDQLLVVTPMRSAAVLRLGPEDRREMVPMRWGWPDRRSGASQARPKHMHAKGETVDRLPTFAPSFHAGRRGIVPVRNFNVGEEVGRKVVQHVLAPRDGRPLGIAVIYDTFASRDGQGLLAFVMCTTPPNPTIATVTDRMPALLPRTHWAAWLGETDAPAEAIRDLLCPWPDTLGMTPQPAPAPRPQIARLPL